jgi:hypothetical protein
MSDQDPVEDAVLVERLRQPSLIWAKGDDIPFRQLVDDAELAAGRLVEQANQLAELRDLASELYELVASEFGPTESAEWTPRLDALGVHYE